MTIQPHVVMITGEYRPQRGGIADYTCCLVSALAEQNVRVSLVAPFGSDWSAAPATLVSELDHWGWSSIGQIKRVLREHAPDWLHIQYQISMYRHPAILLLPTVLRVWGCRVPLAVTFHDLQKPFLFRKMGPVRNWLLARFARSAAMCFAADSGDVAVLRSLGACVRQVPIGSSIPVNPGLNSWQRAAFRGHYNVPEDAWLVGHFGTRYGLETLLEALAALPRAVLLLIGKKAPGEPLAREHLPPELTDQIDRLGLGERVRYTDYLSAARVAEALTAVDLVALPYSTRASLRHSGLMAAVAQGAAIVTTTPRLPMPGLVVGEDLLAAEPGDAAELSETIRLVLSDEALRRRLQQNARRAAQTTFSWDAITAMHWAAYNSY